jgi:hypothetical protein
MICRYRLIGPSEGRTTRVKDWDFVEGFSAWVDRPGEDWEKLDRQMVRFYGCVREEQEDGGTESSGEVAFQSIESGAAQKDADEIEFNAEAEERGARAEAFEGDRHERPADKLTLLEAVDQLDPSCDEHWSANGKPNIMLLRKWTGQQIVRAEVERVAGWMTRAYLSANMAEHAR